MPRMTAMLFRLIAGLIKGLLVGALVGFGLIRAGFGPTPGPIVAYAAAATAGVLVGLVAGKPIWAKDAKVEAGMKAIVGAFLGAGLMFAARRWLQVPLPVSLGEFGGPNESLLETLETMSHGSVAGVGMTSLAAVAAVLGAFYDLDNTPAPTEGGPQGSRSAAELRAPMARVGAPPRAPADAADEDVRADRRSKR